MSLWKKIKAKLKPAELDSLDLVEQEMKAEERARKDEGSTASGLDIANIVLAITVALLALFAWRLWR
jgi:hypothetical protein